MVHCPCNTVPMTGQFSIWGRGKQRLSNGNEHIWLCKCHNNVQSWNPYRRTQGWISLPWWPQSATLCGRSPASWWSLSWAAEGSETGRTAGSLPETQSCCKEGFPGVHTHNTQFKIKHFGDNTDDYPDSSMYNVKKNNNLKMVKLGKKTESCKFSYLKITHQNMLQDIWTRTCMEF